jgi:hypothetical protein
MSGTKSRFARRRRNGAEDDVVRDLVVLAANPVRVDLDLLDNALPARVVGGRLLEELNAAL